MKFLNTKHSQLITESISENYIIVQLVLWTLQAIEFNRIGSGKLHAFSGVIYVALEGERPVQNDIKKSSEYSHRFHVLGPSYVTRNCCPRVDLVDIRPEPSLPNGCSFSPTLVPYMIHVGQVLIAVCLWMWHMCARAYVHACVCVYNCVRVLCRCSNNRAHIFAIFRSNLHIYIYIYIYIYMYMCACIYVYIYICIYIHNIYIYIYI